MLMRSTKKIFWIFFLVLLIIISNAVLLYLNLIKLTESQKPVIYALGAQRLLNNLLTEILAAESAQYSYFISYEENTLSTYYRARGMIVSARAQLLPLLRDKPKQIERFRALNELLEQRHDLVQQAIAAQTVHSKNNKSNKPPNFLDNQLIVKIRGLIEQISREEILQLEQHQDILNDATEQAIINSSVTFTIAVLFNVLLLSLMFRLVLRAVHEHNGREMAMQQHNHELSTSLAEIGWHNQYVSLLAELSGFLQACTDLGEVSRLLDHFAPRLFDVGGGALYLFASSRNHLEMLVYWGREPKERFFAAESCWGLRRGQAYISNINGLHLRCTHIPEHVDSYACLPLTAQGEIIGLLFLEQLPENPGRFDLALVEMAAEQLAMAIANLKLRQRLQQQSIRDPLTGLYNRRYFQEAASRELSRAGRLLQEHKSARLALLMVDVDYFKDVNDRFGHEVGDILLCALATMMVEQTRMSDIVCRYGGEEFVILMPEVDPQSVLERAESVRESIAKLKLTHHELNLGQITVSIGVAIYPLHGKSIDMLVAAADEALYVAKGEGRNLVKLAAIK